MTIKEFAKYLSKIEATSSRNEITEILARLIATLRTEESREAAYLILGRLGPLYEEKKFVLAEKLMLRVIAQAFAVTEKKVQQAYRQQGDLGNAASIFSAEDSEQKHKGSVPIGDLFKQLKQIAGLAGKGSVAQKIETFADLLGSLDSLSVRYVVRIPLGRLRLGFSEVTVLDALSLVEAGDKSLRPVFEAAYNVSADIGKIVYEFKKLGLKGMRRITVTPGIPIRMTAAERLPSAAAIIEKIGRSSVEPKYDGFRVQIHRWQENGRQRVAVFSRNLENTTAMFPDIVKEVEKIKNTELIFEGEAIGYNPRSGRYLPFQETIQRKRKYDIKKLAKSIPLKVFAYDLLYAEGVIWMERPYQQRREKLESILAGLRDDSKDTLITPAPKIITDEAAQIEAEFDRAISEGLEGLVVKRIDAPYQAGARSYNWVKLKRASRKGLSDTLDLVVLGYFQGRGKRRQFGIGALLTGLWDPKTQKYYTIAKIGTGPSDEEWREFRRRLKTLKTKSQPPNYEIPKGLKPDFWVRPAVVIEIETDEITKSPLHTALREKFGTAGLALRFPRFVRFRDDKNPEQTTSPEEVLHLYSMQGKNSKT